jgi:hypothetical protein
VQINKKWLGLHCIESPEVLFFDVMEVKVSSVEGRDADYSSKIDAKFIEACDSDSIKIIATHSDGISAAAYTAKLAFDAVEIHVHQFKVQREFSVRVTLAGVRNGYEKIRFPEFTEEQAKKNESFWNSSR